MRCRRFKQASHKLDHGRWGTFPPVITFIPIPLWLSDRVIKYPFEPFLEGDVVGEVIGHGQARLRYLPVRVSTRMVSPGLMKMGTATSMPVSTLAGLVTLVAVSPRIPGGASRTLRSTEGDNSSSTTLPSTSVNVQRRFSVR